MDVKNFLLSRSKGCFSAILNTFHQWMSILKRWRMHKTFAKVHSPGGAISIINGQYHTLPNANKVNFDTLAFLAKIKTSISFRKWNLTKTSRKPHIYLTEASFYLGRVFLYDDAPQMWMVLKMQNGQKCILKCLIIDAMIFWVYFSCHVDDDLKSHICRKCVRMGRSF